MKKSGLKISFVLFGLLVNLSFSFAQENTVFGKVGNQIIDQDFISVMQILHPEFGYTPDSSAFSERLFKQYLLLKAEAEDAREKKLNESPAVKKNIELIKQLAEDAYLSFLKGKKNTDTNYDVSDAEALAYYNTHSAIYSMPGEYSYFVATIMDTVLHPVADVKKQLKQYASFVTDEFKAGDGNSFKIIFIKDHKITSDDPTYQVLNKLNANDFSGTLSDGNTKVIYLLLKKTAPRLTAFETVKEACRTNVINEKRAKADNDFIKKILTKYPIVLDKNYFKH